MIRSFRCRDTQRVFYDQPTRKFPPDLLKRARIKLLLLDAATAVEDLQEPPSNRLELLRGDRAGQYSIRINRQWRLCFDWSDAGAENVEIVDYHQEDTMGHTGRLGAIHPGEILREEFLEPLGMSAYRLAKGTGMTESAVGDILHGRRSITAATALRLSRFLGCSPEFWLNLQASYDLGAAREQLNDRLESIEPVDLDEAHRRRMRELEERRRRLHAELPAEQTRLAEELAAIQRTEPVAA